MKRFLTTALAVMLMLSLAACGKSSGTKTNADALHTTAPEASSTTTQPTTEAAASTEPMLSTAYKHSSFIDSNGNLYGWGENGEYQLGLSNNIDKSSPVLLSSEVKKIVTYPSLTVFLKNDGRLYTCGYNENGKAGNATYRNTGPDGPKNILSDITDFEHNGSTGAAINSNHELFMWGQHFSNTPTKVLDGVEKIVVNEEEMAIIKTNGDLYRWYHDHWYHDGRDNNYPICTTEANTIEDYKLIGNAKDVFMDTNITAILTNSNELYVHGTFIGTEAPEQKPAKILDNIASCSVNHSYLLALTTDGRVYRYGYSDDTIMDVFAPVLTFENAKKIYTSREFYMIIDNNNTLYGYGSSTDGVLGFTSEDTVVLTDDYYKKYYELLDNVDYIQLEYERGDSKDTDSVAAVTLNKELYVWGTGTLSTSAKQPLKILDNVTKLCYNGYGSTHAIALCDDNSLYSWGENYVGEIGNGTTEKQLIPCKISIPYY